MRLRIKPRRWDLDRSKLDGPDATVQQLMKAYSASRDLIETARREGRLSYRRAGRNIRFPVDLLPDSLARRQPAAAEVPDKLYLTPAEAAAALNVDRRTVYNHMRSGKLPARKIGGVRCIPSRLLSDFVG